MADILIVDDSPLDRRLAGRLLEEIGLRVRESSDGCLALDEIEKSAPSIVLTDLQMPNMDGLELVRKLQKSHESLPVVLMTAHGSEEIAVEALEAGAASYVPKHNLARDLVATVKSVLSVTRARHHTRSVLDSMKRMETEFVLGNSVEGLDALIGNLKEQLRQMRHFLDRDILRVSTSLYEAILNAIEHGNLELESSQRDEEGPYYRRVVEKRGTQPPYRNRHVYVNILLTRSAVTLTVRDEGKGFDPNSLADPTSPEMVGETNGRGLFLIRTFMDEVTFNDSGNEITMTKFRTR